MTDCEFCEIIAGDAPGSRVYEDDIVIVIMTTGPVNPGHILVLPKKHAACMAEMDEETGAHLFKIAMRSARAIRESGVRCEGVNLFLADGKAAFQEIFHLHLHIFPRFEGDSFGLVADWSVKSPRQELDKIATLIGQAYKNLWSEKSKKV